MKRYRTSFELTKLFHPEVGFKSFQRLLDAYVEVEDLQGPMSIAKMELDLYERVTENHIIPCQVCIFDEFFKVPLSTNKQKPKPGE